MTQFAADDFAYIAAAKQKQLAAEAPAVDFSTDITINQLYCHKCGEFPSPHMSDRCPKCGVICEDVPF